MPAVPQGTTEGAKISLGIKDFHRTQMNTDKGRLMILKRPRGKGLIGTQMNTEILKKEKWNIGIMGKK